MVKYSDVAGIVGNMVESSNFLMIAATRDNVEPVLRKHYFEAFGKALVAIEQTRQLGLALAEAELYKSRQEDVEPEDEEDELDED